jgi:DNA polymerase I-like protein with 3'-5' exonuclease and polymerase domains
VHPDFLDVMKLPLCRKYILPDEGHTFLHRDFDGQELRVFAHFEQGQLWSAYQKDAAIDPHAIVGAELLRLTGIEMERTKIKVLNFQAIYGGGAPAAQRKLNCSLAEAKEYKAFHDKALPGRKILSEEITKLCRLGEPIRTLGGRLYFAEPPRFVKKLGRIIIQKEMHAF